jgi:ribosome biogenesis GTPase
VAGAITEPQVVAANIDTIFIVMGCDDDFNLRRLERYLVLAWESGATPVVLLNKADLQPASGSGVEELKAQAERQVAGVPVLLTSAVSGAGFDQVDEYLEPGRTIALLGSSGVGKSSIINRLLGTDRLRIGHVRASDRRGRHTTRHRELVRLPGGAMLIDTPGMRELQLWDVGQGVAEAFDDIAALAPGCRFRDCEHRSEPGCAVRAAVEAGELPAERLASYLKLDDERREFEARHDERAQLEAKRRSRILSKAVRQQQQQFKRRTD